MKNRIIDKVYDGLFGWSAAEGGGGNSPGGGGSTGGGGGGSSDEEWIGDGNTHIWITLPEGRTSPMLGVCPNGTVTVDWGDGTTPDTLTGLKDFTRLWTPTHHYAAPGEYVITLTVEGRLSIMGEQVGRGGSCILRQDKANTNSQINSPYLNAVRKVEIGNNTFIREDAFNACRALTSVYIPEGVTFIGGSAFYDCYSLTNINIPESLTYIGDVAFRGCYSLKSINIPAGVTTIPTNTFYNCHSLANIHISENVTIIGPMVFEYCQSLTSVHIPEGVTFIGNNAFNSCYSLASVNIPTGVTSITEKAFYYCYSLASIHIPESVTSIQDQAFDNCQGMKFYDFSNHTAVPTLSNTDAFNAIPNDCEIRVPAALVDEWKAATNWSTYASKIVAV